MIKIVTEIDPDINFVDMHHHSTYSDGFSSPGIIAKVAKKNNFGVCITDHNEIKGSLLLSKKVFTIPSIEVTSRQSKDILVYFYSFSDLISFWEKEIKCKIKNNRGFNFNKTSVDLFGLLDKIKEYNGISVLAHPFAKFSKTSYNLLNDKSFLKKLGGIESHNFVCGQFEKSYNHVKKFNKPLTAGGDSHSITKFNVMTGSYATDIDSFLDDIIKKKNIIYYENDIIRRLYEVFFIIKNNIRLF